MDVLKKPDNKNSPNKNLYVISDEFRPIVNFIEANDDLSYYYTCNKNKKGKRLFHMGILDDNTLRVEGFDDENYPNIEVENIELHEVIEFYEKLKAMNKEDLVSSIYEIRISHKESIVDFLESNDDIYKEIDIRSNVIIRDFNGNSQDIQELKNKLENYDNHHLNIYFEVTI